MKEVEAVRDIAQPHEILFVVDAMTGQDAVHTAKAFHERLNFDGVVLTKLDGDSRGGAALSIRAVVQKPIKFMVSVKSWMRWNRFIQTALRLAFSVWVIL